MDPEVETTATEPGSGETASNQKPASTPVPATQPDPDPNDPRIQRLVREAEARVQQAKDRELAETHRRYQERERGLKQRVRDGMTPEEAQRLESEMSDQADLADYRAWKAQQAALQESQAMANQVASAFGLRGDDPRLQGAASWDDFREKCKKALADDNRQAREAEAAAARQAEQGEARAALPGAASLGASPSPLKPGQSTLRAEYEKELARAQGNPERIVEIKWRYREKGLEGI